MALYAASLKFQAIPLNIKKYKKVKYKYVIPRK